MLSLFPALLPLSPRTLPAVHSLQSPQTLGIEKIHLTLELIKVKGQINCIEFLMPLNMKNNFSNNIFMGKVVVIKITL